MKKGNPPLKGAAKGGKKGPPEPPREDGLNLWHAVTRSIKPYAETGSPLPPPPAYVSAKKTGHPPPTSLRQAQPRAERSRVKIERKLDLHGMTQQKAFETLCQFIEDCAVEGKRNLLVITGKGTAPGGVLKRMLPLWLEGPRLARHVAAVTPAEPKDGGAGAFYLQLQKQR